MTSRPMRLAVSSLAVLAACHGASSQGPDTIPMTVRVDAAQPLGELEKAGRLAELAPATSLVADQGRLSLPVTLPRQGVSLLVFERR